MHNRDGSIYFHKYNSFMNRNQVDSYSILANTKALLEETDQYQSVTQTCLGI